MSENVDRHGRVAGHPDEFLATADELSYFDAGLVLGFFRRLEVLIDACPIDIYAASSLKHPWPHRLQNAAECYPASFWRSQNRLLDSAISTPELTNEDVLDHADERYATSVAAKDYLPFDAYEEKYQNDKLTEGQIQVVRHLESEFGDHITATTESIREFADIYDPDEHPQAYVPIQPPYDEHIDIVYPIVESSALEHRYMLGGLANATPERRIDELLSFRSAVGDAPVAHGLGWGLSDQLVALIRDEPEVLDSVDNSSPSQAVQNDKVLDKHWRARPCEHVDGTYQNTAGGAFEFAMLVQAVHRMTEYNDDFEDVEPRDRLQQAQIGEFWGATSDD